MVRQGVLIALALAGIVRADQDPRAVLDRAMADFQAGRLAASIRGFDQVAKLEPAAAAGLWQRGIALYYAGRFKECRAQFELHRTVNPDDVENAAWHFLCVARDESPEAAKTKLLPVGPDGRRPMSEIYRMYLGKMTPAEVMTAAGANTTSLFYAHLYVGLYLEATGEAAAGLDHLKQAASPRYASAGGYMHDVARVHLIAR
ncbi:MAG: hypothetical protein ABI665_07315 [Vicinamibacterales bacterium]